MAVDPHYVELAVDTMIARYASQMQAELTIVEGENSLTAGDLTPPLKTLDHFAPNDNASPLLQIYDDAGIGVVNQRGGHWEIPVAVVLSYASLADLSVAARFVRRYVTAMLRVVIKDPTLGGAVMQAAFNDAEALRTIGDSSTTRLHYALGFAVQLHEAEA